MRPKHHEIVCIVDRSGSMQSVKKDAIGGFNAFIQAQRREPAPARVTLVLFDHEIITVCEDMPIDEVAALDESSYVPRGQTALLDALGRALADTYVRIRDTSEDRRPEKVVVVVLTDGQENSSVEFDLRSISELIGKRRNEDGWQFVFIAADEDVIRTACRLSIEPGDTYRFEDNRSGVEEAFSRMADMVSERRRRR